jgi:hypothetical protein
MQPCPQCGDEDVRPLSAVHAQGTRTSESVSGGSRLTFRKRGGITPSYWRSQSSRVSQTVLAKQCAPPARADLGCVATLMVLSLVVAAGVTLYLEDPGPSVNGHPVAIAALITGLVLFLVFLAAVVGQRKWNREQYPALYEAWERTWLCMRCTHRFQPAGDETDPEDLLARARQVQERMAHLAARFKAINAGEADPDEVIAELRAEEDAGREVIDAEVFEEQPYEPPERDIAEQLDDLARLLDEGSITKREFRLAKKKLLGDF